MSELGHIEFAFLIQIILDEECEIPKVENARLAAATLALAASAGLKKAKRLLETATALESVHGSARALQRLALAQLVLAQEEKS